jgi:hypothetical protein
MFSFSAGAAIVSALAKLADRRKCSGIGVCTVRVRSICGRLKPEPRFIAVRFIF